jgi:hypothetical protein
MRGQELPLLDVDWFARLGDGTNEVSLPAQEGGRLKHIHNGGHAGNIGFGVHIGEDRHMQFALDLGQNFQTFFHARAAKGAA